VLDLNRVIRTLSLQARLGYITTKSFWLGALHFLSEFFYCSISLPKSMSYYCTVLVFAVKLIVDVTSRVSYRSEGMFVLNTVQSEVVKIFILNLYLTFE